MTYFFFNLTERLLVNKTRNLTPRPSERGVYRSRIRNSRPVRLCRMAQKESGLHQESRFTLDPCMMENIVRQVRKVSTEEFLQLFARNGNLEMCWENSITIQVNRGSWLAFLN